jgi:superfamily I DNA/RNA helicase
LQALVDAGLQDNLDAISIAFDPAKSDAEPDPEKRRWLESDLTDLRSAALEVATDMAMAHERNPKLTALSLARAMNVLRYRIATRAPLRREDDEPRVQIMTLHSAKGLEADNIVVMGAADEIVAGNASAEETAEQRRLLYVAVTRAKDSLVISWSRAVPYADALANGIRIGHVITENGELVAKLGRTSLLPQAMAGGTSGQAWLAAES